jgi:hypothetical protein
MASHESAVVDSTVLSTIFIYAKNVFDGANPVAPVPEKALLPTVYAKRIEPTSEAREALA